MLILLSERSVVAVTHGHYLLGVVRPAFLIAHTFGPAPVLSSPVVKHGLRLGSEWNPPPVPSVCSSNMNNSHEGDMICDYRNCYWNPDLEGLSSLEGLTLPDCALGYVHIQECVAEAGPEVSFILEAGACVVEPLAVDFGWIAIKDIWHHI
jgi:hypothetical protein